jgi:hypothetical protein
MLRINPHILGRRTYFPYAVLPLFMVSDGKILSYGHSSEPTPTQGGWLIFWGAKEQCYLLYRCLVCRCPVRSVLGIE